MRVLPFIVYLTLSLVSCDQVIAQFVPPKTKSESTWSSTLPNWVRKSILWEADMEEGDRPLIDWHDDGPGRVGGSGSNLDFGGGIFIVDPTGGDEAKGMLSDLNVAHTGVFSVAPQIRNATRSSLLNSDAEKDTERGVQLVRWRDAQSNLLPRSAYYSTFIYIPDDYDPCLREPWGTPGNDWWMMLEFRSQDMTIDRGRDPDGHNRMFSLQIDKVGSEPNRNLSLYLWSPPAGKSYVQPDASHKKLPTRQWVHIEVFYKAEGDKTGQIKVWQDGEVLFNVRNVQTLNNPSDRLNFGLANYTEHVDGGSENGAATLFFDDAIISKRKVHPYLNLE